MCRMLPTVTCVETEGPPELVDCHDQKDCGQLSRLAASFEPWRVQPPPLAPRSVTNGAGGAPVPLLLVDGQRVLSRLGQRQAGRDRRLQRRQTGPRPIPRSQFLDRARQLARGQQRVHRLLGHRQRPRRCAAAYETSTSSTYGTKQAAEVSAGFADQIQLGMKAGIAHRSAVLRAAGGRIPLPKTTGGPSRADRPGLRSIASRNHLMPRVREGGSVVAAAAETVVGRPV